jgi:MSHA biogenesis protein MshJ
VKAALKRYTERIDNATLRERALLFGAAALALVFLVNSILIEPLRVREKALSAEITRQDGELRTVQAELQRLVRSQDSDPDALNRKRAVELRAELKGLESSLVEEQRRFTSPQRMRQVLEEMLERNKGLRLVDLKTLPVTDLAGAQGPAARRVYRHGVELTLSGSYLELYAYLTALERSSTRLYWGKVDMQVAGYPVATLKLTVYTLSFEQAWLVV